MSEHFPDIVAFLKTLKGYPDQVVEAAALEAASALEALVKERDAYRKRLEIDVAYQMGDDGQMVEVPAPEGFPDGIECRNATIQLQDERIARLQSQLEDAREALSPFARCWRDLPEGENGYHHVHMLIEPSRGFVSLAQVRDFRKAAEVFAALAPPSPSQDGGK